MKIYYLMGQRLILGITLIAVMVILINQALFLIFPHDAVDAPMTFKAAKLGSLIVMNIQGIREIDAIVMMHHQGLGRFLKRFYTFVQIYVWCIAGVTIVALWRPTEFPAWFEIYGLNLLLLAPVFIYTVPNYLCVRSAKTPADIKLHMGWFLYFLNMPVSASIIAFALIAAFMINDPKAGVAATYFVGGATALLLFLIHAITVCIDRQADLLLYHAPPRGVDLNNALSYFLTASVLLGCGLAIGYLMYSSDPATIARWGGRLGIVAGTALITHAFWADGWRGFWLSTLSGALYSALGLCILYPKISPWLLGIMILLVPVFLAFIRFRLSKAQLPTIVRYGLISAVPFIAAIIIAILVHRHHIGGDVLAGGTQSRWVAVVVLSAELFVHGLWWIWLASRGHFARIPM